MNTDILKNGIKRFSVIAVFIFTAIVLFLVLGSTKTEAKTYTIKTPSQLKNINWKNKGYGPGNTYKIGNDMTLGDGDDATCRLTKGKFTIDFNGHTVQNANNSMTVFVVSGANVVMEDSKVKGDTPSVRSYGAGAVQITSGSLTIKNGNYFGLSNGANNPAGLHVGGGTCTVNGGKFYGDHVGASCSGGKLRINGGTFRTSYMFALLDFGGNIKITRGTFTNSKVSYYSPTFALGAWNKSGSAFSFSKMLASGSSFSPSLNTLYWNGTGAEVSQYPTYTVYYFTNPYNYAVSYTGNSGYEVVTVKVNTTAVPASTSIKSVKSGSKALTVKWKKQTSKTTGYQLQYSTSKKFKKAKSVTVKGASKGKKKLAKLKSGKKYYVRIRTYHSINGTKFYSAWSKAKSKKTK